MGIERIGRLLPKKILNWIDAQLIYNDKKISVDKFAGQNLMKALLLGFVVALVLFFVLKISLFESIAGFVGIALLIFVVPLFMLTSSADAEGKKVEKILPDALQLIASNIKAGLTTERALFISALPEFGALSKELKKVSKEILGGEKMEHALMGITKRIKSSVLDRTIWLIVQGIKNGGQISNLLVQLGDDLREENALKGEINANISMYVMLIFFSAAFGAPALFGISSFIVGVLAEQSSISGISPELIEEFSNTNPALSLLGGSSSTITEEFIVLFSELALIVTGIFAGFVLGIISTGKEKGGIKYIPILLIISFILFFVVRTVVSSMFGTMLF